MNVTLRHHNAIVSTARAALLVSMLLLVTPGSLAEELVVQDCAGRVTLFDSDDPHHPFRIPPGMPTQRITSTGITFLVTYVDVDTSTGVGFDDPLLGATRRATLSAVLSYVDSVLNESGAVQIRVSSGSVGGALAAAGPMTPSTPGFYNGHAFDHITTGVDPNGPTTPEMTMTVDFTHPWNEDLGPPAASEFDLFSVMLHEVTHGLGFLSNVNSQGINAIKPGVLTVFDSLIELEGAVMDKRLWILVGGTPQFQGTPQDLISGDLVFGGSNAAAAFGSKPPVGAFKGLGFFIGLSHWAPGFPVVAVMEGSSTPGEMVREYAPVDQGALVDIGWTNFVLNSPPEVQCGDPAVGNDPGRCDAAVLCDDVASCTDPDGDPLTTSCSPSGPYAVGATSVTVDCSDGMDTTTVTCTVNVDDTEAPAGAITSPSDGVCVGAPVTIEDDFTDNCNGSLIRTYLPGPGPTYDHGTHDVTLTLEDDAGNVAQDSVAFTVDTMAPEVELLGLPDRIDVPSALPFALIFQSGDDDGADGGVVHEVVKLDACTIYDGDTWGNGDGLLSDETLVLSPAELCRIWLQCGFDVLVDPELRIEAADCAGNTGAGAHVFAGTIAVNPVICGR